MRLYKVEFQGFLKTNHSAFVLQTGEKTFDLYHVDGSLQKGFRLDIKYNYDLEKSTKFIKSSKILLGDIDKALFISIIKRTPIPGPESNPNSGRDARNCRSWAKEVESKLIFK